MIATTKGQSARLLACGVSADTADIVGVEPDYDYVCEPWSLMQGQDTRGYFPAWGLSALMTKVLPHNISVDKYKYKGATEYEVGCYFTGHRDKIAFNAPDPIEACVQLIEWLTANGYKLHDPDCLCREKGGENDC